MKKGILLALILGLLLSFSFIFISGGKNLCDPIVPVTDDSIGDEIILN